MRLHSTPAPRPRVRCLSNSPHNHLRVVVVVTRRLHAPLALARRTHVVRTHLSHARRARTHARRALRRRAHPRAIAIAIVAITAGPRQPRRATRRHATPCDAMRRCTHALRRLVSCAPMYVNATCPRIPIPTPTPSRLLSHAIDAHDVRVGRRASGVVVVVVVVQYSRRRASGVGRRASTSRGTAPHAHTAERGGHTTTTFHDDDAELKHDALISVSTRRVSTNCGDTRRTDDRRPRR